jgi:nucleoside 2-deoxyribosyltransferase/uncharacterized Zn finger protein (UPF0148 family)
MDIRSSEKKIVKEDFMSQKTCVICGCKEASIKYYYPEIIKCPVCGTYYLNYGDIKKGFDIEENDSQGAKKIAQEILKRIKSELKSPFLYDYPISNDEIDEKAALLKYHVRLWAAREAADYKPLQITPEWLKDIIALDYSYPNPAKQVDYLVRFLGDELKHPGEQYNYNEESINWLKLISATATIDGKHMYKILEYTEESKLIKKNNTDLELTLDGWGRYNESKRGDSDSKMAFMAMQFEGEQKKFIEDTVKPIVKELKLDLNILPDIYSKENIIDLKLRNAIKDCRLLICDLTHRNNGAYFEAGFAEGLGKPVIYICDENTYKEHEKSNDKSKKLHFDVEHQEIYRWDKGNQDSIKKFQNDLKEKIKAVL